MKTMTTGFAAAIVLLMSVEMASINLIFPFCLAAVRLPSLSPSVVNPLHCSWPRQTRSFGVSEEWEGFASGLLAAGYSVGQACSGKVRGLHMSWAPAFLLPHPHSLSYAWIQVWGRVSDQLGRKHVIIGGLSAAAVCMISFGLATNFFAALLSRFLGGICNGFTGILKAVLTEHTSGHGDSLVRTKAFLLMQIGSSCGAIIGPLLGGVLVGDTSSKLPYLLPCLACATLQFLACFMGAFFLPQSDSPGCTDQATSQSQSQTTCPDSSDREEGKSCAGDVRMLQPEFTSVDGNTFEDFYSGPHSSYQSLPPDFFDDPHKDSEPGGTTQARAYGAIQAMEIGWESDGESRHSVKDLARTAAINIRLQAAQARQAAKDTANEVAHATAEAAKAAKASSQPSLFRSMAFSVAVLLNAASALLDELTSVSAALLLGWPAAAGGVGLESDSVGLVFGTAGLGMLAIVLLGLPPLQKSLGPSRVYCACHASPPNLFLNLVSCRFLPPHFVFDSGVCRSGLSSIVLSLVMVAMPTACLLLSSRHTLCLLITALMALSNGSSAACLVCANIFVQVCEGLSTLKGRMLTNGVMNAGRH